MRNGRTIVILAVVAAVTMAIAIPALAQDADSGEQRTKHVREWPPAWIDTPLDELKAEVGERAAAHVERVEASRWLSEDQKAEILTALDEMLAAVDDADANAEVAGLVASRSQLARLDLRADRRNSAVDYEDHITGDLDRAVLRLERLTKVTGWAELAGEDVGAINGYLDEADVWLEVVSSDGSVTERHDGVHVSLAWMIEAAAALDDL